VSNLKTKTKYYEHLKK